MKIIDAIFFFLFQKTTGDFAEHQGVSVKRKIFNDSHVKLNPFIQFDLLFAI